jgi:hypothetical protein
MIFSELELGLGRRGQKVTVELISYCGIEPNAFAFKNVRQ